MPLIRTTPPALEPVTLAEAKAHLRLGTADEDGLLSQLIATARESLERRLGRALITQSWSLWLDAWPGGHAVPLPLPPVRSIAAVRLFDASHVATTLAPATYWLDAVSMPARLLSTDGAWPRPGRAANGIEIAFTAGHGDLASEVPEPIRQALLVSVAALFENREGLAAPMPPATALDLIAPYREWRL